MIVFRKAIDRTQKTAQEPVFEPFQNRLFLRTLQKAANIPFPREPWPRLYQRALAVHEQNPVFFPDDVGASPLKFITNTGRSYTGESASTTGTQNGGSYHIHSPDRFDAQTLMAYYVKFAASYGHIAPLLSYDSETSGVRTKKSDPEPSVPWEVGWHAGGIQSPESRMLQMPDTVQISAATAKAIGQRANGGYPFHNTPMHEIEQIDSLLASSLKSGAESRHYHVDTLPSGDTFVTHKRFKAAGLTTYDQIHTIMQGLMQKHFLIAYNAAFDARMLHSLAETLARADPTKQPDAFSGLHIIDAMRPYARIAGILAPSWRQSFRSAYHWPALPRENPMMSHDAGGDAEILSGLLEHLATVPPDIWRQSGQTAGPDERASRIRALWGAVRFRSHFAQEDYPRPAPATPLDSQQRSRIDDNDLGADEIANHKMFSDTMDSFYGGADHYRDGMWQFIEHQLRRDSAMHFFNDSIAHSLGNGQHSNFSLQDEAESFGRDPETGSDGGFDHQHGQHRFSIQTSERSDPESPDRPILALPSRTTDLPTGVLPHLTVVHSWVPNNSSTGQLSSSQVLPPPPEATIDAMGYRPIRSIATIAHLFMQTRPMILKNGKVTLIPVHEATRDHRFLAYPRPNGVSTQWVDAARHSKSIHAALTSYIATNHPEIKISDVDKDLWKVSDNHAADALTITPDLIPQQATDGAPLSHPAEMFLAPHILQGLHALGVKHAANAGFALGATKHLIEGGHIPHPSDRSPTAPTP